MTTLVTRLPALGWNMSAWYASHISRYASHIHGTLPTFAYYVCIPVAYMYLPSRLQNAQFIAFAATVTPPDSSNNLRAHEMHLYASWIHVRCVSYTYCYASSMDTNTRIYWYASHALYLKCTCSNRHASRIALVLLRILLGL